MSAEEKPSYSIGPPPAARPGSAVNRWLIALSVLFGAIMSVMDVSVVNVALPHMMGSFGRTLSEVTWVATSYSIAEIIMATMAGWWSTLIGRKRLYVISFVIFTIGSVLAGTAKSFEQMLFYRTVQGVGGGALIPVSLAILRETFPPEEQGMAMSFYGMGVVVAPAIGPVLGGWLTDTYGWPWIFYINVPFALVGIWMVTVFLEDPPYLRRGVERVDWGGILLLTVGLTGMQVVLERGQENDWFASNLILITSIITAAALVGLVIWELRRDEPVVDLPLLLHNAPLAAGSGIGILFGMALYGSTFLLPALLQTMLGYDAYDAGITLLPRAVTLFLMMPMVGWLYNHLDPRVLIGVGILLIYWSFEGLAHLSTDVSYWNLVPILVVMGAGMSFQFVNLTTLSVSTVPREHMTGASSLYTLSRRVGGNIGYALLATVVARRSQFHRVQLVQNLTPTNPAFLSAQGFLQQQLHRAGEATSIAGAHATSLLDRLVDQQSTLMAYNDASRFIGIIFITTLPLIFLFPRRQTVGTPPQETTAASIPEV
jgi:MFS transporter, DHA2 family, multidrug resistance protein